MALIKLETGGLVCPFPLIDAKKKMALLFKEMKIGLLNGASLGLMTFVILGFYIHFFKKCQAKP